jgi:hypothetical protein
MPTNTDEFEQMEREQKNVRLPMNDQEQNDLAGLAPQGPAAVYKWLYGENSLMAKKAQALTWADLGESDPVTGCRKMVEQLRLLRVPS